MKDNKLSLSSKICLVMSALIILSVKILTPPAGLPAAGFQILGILIVAVILFLSNGVGWTSMFIVFLMMTVPGFSAAAVTQATFGNSTAVFLLFCFMLAACLTESGVAQRLAIWFLTNKLARKSPWLTVLMYFASVYFLDLFLSSATCIMIFLPLLMSIFESIRVDKSERYAPLTSMLLLGTVSVALLANGTNPISHAVTTQGFSLHESYTSLPMDFFSFSAVTLPISLLSVAVIFLVVRFLWRPDVSPFTHIDYDAMAASCGSVSKREKWSLFFYAACVVLWLLPGLSKYIMPSAYTTLNRINNCIPALLALFLMNFIRADGEKILDWEDAVKAMNWNSFMFIATIMGLGSLMGREDVGISRWLSDTLAPIFGSMHPLLFLAIMVILVNILTNFCSNAVALAVIMAVAMPLCLNLFDGMLNPILVSILITSGANNGWATPPATPTAAVAYSSGYGDLKLILKWGMVFMCVQAALCMTVGVAVAKILL